MDPRRFLIYCITNVKNNKRYVGQTCRTVEERWRKHVWLALTRNVDTRFYAAIRKHGRDAFRLSVLQDDLTDVEANEAERRWVAELASNIKEFGYNSTDGGDQITGGWAMTLDAREKIAASKRGKLLIVRRLRTQEEDRPIVDLFKEGVSRREICKRLNVSQAKVQKALARWKERVEPNLKVGKEHQYEQSGLSLQKRANEANAEVFRLFDEGKSRKEVADELDLSYAFVKNVLRRRIVRSRDLVVDI